MTRRRVLLLLITGAIAGATATATPRGESAQLRRVMEELGTLGGQGSVPWDISERGEVVGSSVTARGERHVFLWRKGRMIDLGRFGGNNAAGPIAINDRSQVVWNQQGRGGVLWQNGSRRSLRFTVRAINNRGHVVGCKTRGGKTRAVIWDGRLRKLATFRANAVECAVAINDAREVVGYSRISTSQGNVLRALLWRDGQLHDLGALPGSTHSEPIAINASGQVLGSSSSFSGVGGTFLWQNGRMRDVGVRSATALNNRGQVVGWGSVGVQQHALLWTNGRVRDLGTLGGPYSAALDINNRGQVIGDAHTSEVEKAAFVWENGRMSDIDRAVRGSSAVAINDKGQIIGSRRDTVSGERRAVLWSPAPG